MHWFLHWTGADNGSGPIYLFWSGFFGDVTIFAAVFAGLRHVNCGHSPCWRPYRHTTKNGHKLCKKHIGWPNESLNLHEIHEDHR